MTPEEKVNEYWKKLPKDLQDQIKYIANKPEGKKIMYALMETELAKRGEELDEDKINGLVDKAMEAVSLIK